MMKIERRYVTERFPKRTKYGNKGSYGKVLSVCGSETMMGAAVLAAKGAYVVGAGYVVCAVPEDEKNIIFTSLPEAVVLPLADGKEKAQLNKFIAAAKPTVALIGCGLGEQNAKKYIPSFLGKLDIPVIIDGDGLNALAKTNFKFKKPAVLTPHPLEAARLLGLKKAVTDRKDAAIKIARNYNAVCVLKGMDTVVADGKNVLVNTTGSPALSKAGTGDVLAGMISGIWAQMIAARKGSALEASACAVYLHGLAGEIAEKEISAYSLFTSKLDLYVGRAIKKL